MSVTQRFSLFLCVFLLMDSVLQPVLTAQTHHRVVNARSGDSNYNQNQNLRSRGTWRRDTKRNDNTVNHQIRRNGDDNFTIEDPLLDEMFNAVPIEGDNGPGNAATGALTNAMKAQIPDTCYYWQVNNHGMCSKYNQKTFRSLFAPGYHQAPYEKEIANYTDLNASWLSGCSVAALCKAMYDITSKVRPKLNVGEINGDIALFNEHFRGTWEYYAFVFSQENANFSKAFAAIPNENITLYKNMYISDGLLSPAWITAKKTQASEGTWRDPGPSWEMFHHSIKLHLLGANNTEIDTVLMKVADTGLIFPDEVHAVNWRNYSAWLDTDSMQSSITAAARGQILASRDCGSVFDPVPCCTHGYAGAEYQSLIFVESGYAGYKYVN